MDGEFDLAFSLGQACGCSQSLRLAHLQFASFPLDWIAGGTLDDRVQLVVSRFSHWLDIDDFVYKEKNKINGLGIFINKRTGLCHLHDFEDGPIENSHPKVVAKYARREKRLFDLLGRARRVLAVYVDTMKDNGREAPSIQDLVKARESLSAAFPNASFELVHFSRTAGIPFDRRTVTTPSEGITEIRFDYGDAVTDVRFQDIADALHALGIKVHDYRTRAERKAHSLKRQMKKYGVDSRFALFMAKTKAHLRGLFGHGSIDGRDAK